MSKNRLQQINEAKLSTRELQFLRLWRTIAPAQLPDPVTQHVFHPTRKWRLDFAWPSLKIGLEIHGGTRGKPVICHRCRARVRMPTKSGRPGKTVMLGGRHNNASGLDGDCEKENAAVAGGWRVLKFTTKQLDERPVQCVEDVTALIVACAGRN